MLPKTHLAWRGLIPYWLILFSSTLVIGWIAFQLLGEEWKRLRNVRSASLQQKAQTVSDNIGLIVSDVKIGLMDQLAAFSDDDLIANLPRWIEQNPLICAGFIWTSKGGFAWPLGENGELRRLERLLKAEDRWLWELGGEEPESFKISGPIPLKEEARTENYAGAKRVRQQIRELAYPQYRADALADQVLMAAEEAPGRGAAETRWQFAGSQGSIHLFGWFRAHAAAPVRGIEVDRDVLFNNLEAAFPAPLESGEYYRLSDRSDEPIFSAGRSVYRLVSKPEVSVLLGRELPGWTLDLYQTSGLNFRRGFVTLTSILVGILLFTILAGGTFLLLYAGREAVDVARKRTFVSNVSHELKTPLTTIRMYAELLAEGRVAAEEKRERYLDTIVSESRRLTRLVNNVLDFSRLEEGRKKYHMESLNLGEMVGEVMETQALRIGESEINLQKRFSPNGPLITVDRDALEQTLLNIVDNALKYAGKGKTLSVSIHEDGTEAYVELEDNGPGVPREHQKRIFDVFHRVDDTLTVEQAGSGLGLSLARRMMRDCGGDLRFEPVAEGGARFKVVLSKLKGKHQ